VKITLTQEEASGLARLAGELAARYGSAENPELLFDAPVLAHELPLRVRRHLNEFRLAEPRAGLCVVAGYPVDDQEIGPTPPHWKERQRGCLPLREEIVLVLLGSLLGDVIAWATQQDGAVVHDITPIRGHEHEQMGSGCKEELTWHTEDAFHPFRGDYLGMMCLRNPDRVPTTVASLDVAAIGAALGAESLSRLFEPLYTIRPDNSHQRRNRVDHPGGQRALEAAQDRIEQMNARPEKVPVLFGSPESPYCRLDPYFMDPPETEEARRALDELVRHIDARLEDLVLEPGDVCFIDNFKAVHGRRPFAARFDGTDRWLKRINITRNLRASRTARSSAESRLLL
jgi:Fe(II)/alpha-ketoglutarate-dependent arginine beta-hydroxylase